MFFVLSKIFWALCSPLNLIILLILVGVGLRWLKREVWSRRLLTLGIGLFLVLGILPVGPNLVVYLESRYPAPQLPDKVAGIIVLGGAVNAERSEAFGQTSLGEDGERLTEMLRLSRIYPQTTVIYSGGSGALFPGSSAESAEVKKLLKNMGFSEERFIFEGQSRNTYENMLLSTPLAHPQAGDKWVLITSAFHLPRSAAVFKKGGWDVIPYPAGYLEDGGYFLWRDLDVLGNFYKLQVAMKEIVGIIAYSFTGKL